MSRIGRKAITVPAGVEVTLGENNVITVKGPKGTLTHKIHDNMTVTADAGVITVTRPDDEKENRSLHGLTRTLIANMVEGVTNGYSKKLIIVGVGYKAVKNGKISFSASVIPIQSPSRKRTVLHSTFPIPILL